VAQALYRQGMCYLKLKNNAAARSALSRLVSEYPSQTELVSKAQPLLDELSDFDPAALMPAGTLAYVEWGSPGRQIETFLGMLKDTPYENPLNAIAAQQPAVRRGPGDMLSAFLNPS